MLTKLFARPRTKAPQKNILLTQPWTNVTLPQEVLDVPTMLTVRERQVLHWLARYHANGSGRIVDGGCFLGGSTAALASGLAARSNGHWEKAIATYDLFRVEPYTLLEYREHFSNPTVDASFRKDFDTNLAPWSAYVDVREGDAIDRGWDGEPIEILFLDFVKSWKLNDLVMDKFLAPLIPGHSIIIQQDYMWGFGPWIHITMELLAPYVTVLDSMLCSVVYLLNAPIPERFISAKLQGELSPDTKLKLMDQAVERWQGEQRGMVELARVMLLREIATPAEARAALNKVLSRYEGEKSVLNCGERVASYIADAPWYEKT
jgi:hypothetical protein